MFCKIAFLFIFNINDTLLKYYFASHITHADCWREALQLKKQTKSKKENLTLARQLVINKQ